MSDQPTALRLAGALQQQAVWEGHYGPSYLRDLLPEAAAELRRLHALNAELVEALQAVVTNWTQQFERYGHMAPEWCKKARAVLTKAEASNGS